MDWPRLLNRPKSRSHAMLLGFGRAQLRVITNDEMAMCGCGRGVSAP